jgi:hypothetical protein
MIMVMMMDAGDGERRRRCRRDGEVHGGAC